LIFLERLLYHEKICHAGRGAFAFGMGDSPIKRERREGGGGSGHLVPVEQ